MGLNLSFYALRLEVVSLAISLITIQEPSKGFPRTRASTQSDVVHYFLSCLTCKFLVSSHVVNKVLHNAVAPFSIHSYLNVVIQF